MQLLKELKGLSALSLFLSQARETSTDTKLAEGQFSPVNYIVIFFSKREFSLSHALRPTAAGCCKLTTSSKLSQAGANGGIAKAQAFQAPCTCTLS